MSRSFRLLLWVIALCCCGSAFAQQRRDSGWVATVTGVVRDTSRNYMLASASVAIYKRSDSSLITYQLSNNFGEFHFSGLPVKTGLVIRVNYVGYTEFRREFQITAAEKTIDLGHIDMERNSNMLTEVYVRSRPPVRMNGDTLEFNADAFRLDSNAVGEDLLKKLPGVVVWGDGSITVNGRQVSQVLVDGKPFFGGDTRVATQNISKSAIDKIQVYQQKDDFQRLNDSITSINIKLKRDKNTGHFGKIGAGYGTDRRYEADANINFFRPSTQISVVAATNNINKIASGADVLLQNSSYKGNGARIDYQPNFSLSGTNRPFMTGVSYQHDFIPGVNYYKTDRLSGNYFLNSNKNLTSVNSETLTSIGQGNTLSQRHYSSADKTDIAQTGGIGYEKKNYYQSFYVRGIVSSNNNDVNNNGADSVRLNDGSLESVSDNHSTQKRVSTGFGLDAGFGHSKNQHASTRIPGDIQISYSYRDTSMRFDQHIKTAFTSLTDPTQNAYYDRVYNNKMSGYSHQLNGKIGDLYKWAFGYEGLASHISLSAFNNLHVAGRDNHNHVQDLDGMTGKYSSNAYLTGNSRYTAVDEKPGLDLKLSWYKGFTGRYYRNFSFDLTLQDQFYQLTNRSNKDFQNLSYHYQQFVPEAVFYFTDTRVGRYTNTWMLRFNRSVMYPSVDQLAPLVDSSDRYFIFAGNPALRPGQRNELILMLSHSSNNQNALNFNFTATGGNVEHNFSDSSLVDHLGRTVSYTVNADGYQWMNVNGDLKKAFKFRNSQFQADLSPSLGLERKPGYVNGELYHSLSFTHSASLDLYYTYKDIVAIDLRPSFSHYQALQKKIDAVKFGNEIFSTLFSASVRPLPRLSCGSSIAFTSTSSTGAGTQHFTIWNASVAYRFLQENNLELKLSALDLLHQNTSIINYGSSNFLTHGTVNVLKQYFMATVSFFPRQFGKHSKEPALPQN